MKGVPEDRGDGRSGPRRARRARLLGCAAVIVLLCVAGPLWLTHSRRVAQQRTAVLRATRNGAVRLPPGSSIAQTTYAALGTVTSVRLVVPTASAEEFARRVLGDGAIVCRASSDADAAYLRQQFAAMLAPRSYPDEVGPLGGSMLGRGGAPGLQGEECVQWVLVGDKSGALTVVYIWTLG